MTRGTTPGGERNLTMPWDLALPLLVCFATLLLFVGIYYSAKMLITDPRGSEENE